MIDLRRAFLGLVVATAVGCGDDDGGTTAPTGVLEISTTTTGEPATGITVIVDGASPRSVEANGTLSISDVTPGSHLVQLALPTNCSLEGDNPRTVDVTAGATASIDFVLTCGA